MKIKTTARIGGILYLLIITAGIFSEIFVRNKLIVWDNAAETASNIKSSALLWRAGITADLIMHVFDIPLMLIIYILLKPVNKNLAMLGLLFTLIQTAVLVAFKLKLFDALFLTDYAGMNTAQTSQLNALAFIAIRSDAYGFCIGLLFFGFACIINGYLIFKSGYIPKFIGVLIQIAGLCYIINSVAQFINPGMAAIISPGILIVPFIAELSFCLWLLIKGVRFYPA